MEKGAKDSQDEGAARGVWHSIGWRGVGALVYLSLCSVTALLDVKMFLIVLLCVVILRDVRAFVRRF